MSKTHDKDIKFIKSLLDKPKWYNETLTHPNWLMIKRAIKEMPDYTKLVFKEPVIPEYKRDISQELMMRAIYRPQVIQSSFIRLKVS
jgi:hypothetical protein